MWLPWQLKFVCGIVADSVPLFGSRKKAWIFVWAAIQALSALILATITIESAQIVTLLCFLCSFGGCFMDVIVDSLMVI